MCNCEKYKELLDSVIDKGHLLNNVTTQNKEIDEKTKVIQRAATLCVMEPLFDYMKNHENKIVVNRAKAYKNYLDMLQEHGFVSAMEINEKDNNNNE